MFQKQINMSVFLFQHSLKWQFSHAMLLYTYRLHTFAFRIVNIL